MPTSGGSDPSRFTVADFPVDPERARCTCRNGVVSSRVYAHGAGGGVSFRFPASECRECQLWNACQSAEANPKGHRSIFISDYHVYLRACEVFNQAADGRALLKRR